MKSLKSTTNGNLKKEMFSLNQLIKFATKGDGKQYIKEYIKEKDVLLNEITVANLVDVMPDNIRYIKEKNTDGVFVLTDKPRVKFSFWALLTLIDKLEQSK